MVSTKRTFLMLLCAFALKMCAGQTVISKSTLSYNFTLYAVNTTCTLPNANTTVTGVPLVLGQNGATTGISFYVTSVNHAIRSCQCQSLTYASYPYNDYPALALVNNSMRAFTKTGAWITNATTLYSGKALSWVTSTMYTSPAATNYGMTQSADTAKYPLLSVNGITNLWSLCPYSGGQTNVVFNVSADQPPPPYLGFDPVNCYEVELNIVPIP